MKYLIQISILISILAVGTVAHAQTSSDRRDKLYFQEAEKAKKLAAEKSRKKKEAAAKEKLKREKEEALAHLEETRRKNEDTYAAYTVESLGLKMVWIEAGSFTMGSPTSEDGRDNDEGEHRVTLLSGFWLGMYEVTSTEMMRIMNDGPLYSNGKLGDFATGWIRWDGAMAFCSKLNDIEERAGRLPKGYRYSLPTEAQWEYACRAGTKTSIPGESLDSIAWHPGNTRSKRRPVGMKQPNAWGLCDMLGNSSEWCLDWYGSYPSEDVTDPTGQESGTKRVLRGGSVRGKAKFSRSASRLPQLPDKMARSIGFRLALVSQP